MISLIRRGTIYGGIFLPSAKSATENEPIRLLSLPNILRIPLASGTSAVVFKGERVRQHQCLTRSGSGHSRIFSPVNGEVLGLVRVDTAYDNDVPALEIKVCQTDWRVPTAGDPPSGWDSLSAEEIAGAVRRGGVVGQAGDGGSISETIQQARQQGVSNLIIGGLESEPCLTTEHRLLTEHAPLIIKASSCLHTFLGVRRTRLVLDADRRDLVKTLSDLARRTPVRVTDLPNRYPIGETPLLVQAILGLEIPTGRCSIDIGVVVLSVGTVFHLARAIFERTPQTARLITVAGEGVAHPGNYWIAAGTSVAHVLEQVGGSTDSGRLVVGGPMTGKIVRHRDVVLTTRCLSLLALPDPAAQARPSACVHCGWCAEVCPMRLEPAALLKTIELQQPRRTARLHVGTCIECGLCSYVCLSLLPLASSIGGYLPPPQQ